MAKAKPFGIPKRWVWEAYQRVKVNRGAAGVDEQSIEAFERDVTNNLYKLWNRLSSGSYFPPPVRRVEIKKRGGGMRPLGVPTVSDRIAQGVVRAYLEPDLERHFHSDSYGYRPGKSALEAFGVARQRCWRYDWVLDLDIQAFFDTIPHDLLLRAVRKHTDCRWVLLYVERWLKASVQHEDDTLEPREKGTPQGSVVSPLLPNLFLHYAFDRWMADRHPNIPFERFADDILCHCSSEAQAQWLRGVLERRFAECGLKLHPSKTKIVYCKDGDRRGCYPNESFDYLGYTFRPRRSKNRWGKYFVNFSPGVSSTATKAIRQRIRDWQLGCRIDKRIDDLARIFNPIIRGWMNYRITRLTEGVDFLGFNFVKRRSPNTGKNTIYIFPSKASQHALRRRRARNWIRELALRDPDLMAHWRMLHHVVAGR